MSGWSNKPAVLRVLLACTSLLALSPACAKREPSSAAPSLLRVSQRNEPATLDPHRATLPDEFFILRALSEGLLTPNPHEGPPLPGVAERWEVSPDGLIYTFHLRADARWSDGKPVTAQDFIASFRRALTPALGAPKTPLFHDVAGARAYHRGELTDFSQVGFSAPDNHTLVITLEHPAPHLPALAASGPWLPVHPPSVARHEAEGSRDAAWTRAGHFIGNGPFILTEWRSGQHLLVTPNPHYHARERVHLAGIRFQIYDSGDTEERAFRAGQVDVTMAVPFAKLGAYSPPVLRRVPLHETRYFALNTARAPLHDPRVRRALALAIDRDALVRNVLRGGQTPALGLVPTGLGRYHDAPQLTPDPAEARALLAAAGFPGGRGFPRLELTTWVNTPVLEAVQQMWRRELGIETAIVQREGKVHMASVLAGDHDLAFMPLIPDYDDAGAVFCDWLTGAPGNHAGWSDPRYDALVREAAQTPAEENRFALYRAAETILLEAMPGVPLYFNTQHFLVSPRVRGWRQDALWNRFYLDLSLE